MAEQAKRQQQQLDQGWKGQWREQLAGDDMRTGCHSKTLVFTASGIAWSDWSAELASPCLRRPGTKSAVPSPIELLLGPIHYRRPWLNCARRGNAGEREGPWPPPSRASDNDHPGLAVHALPS
ncbi:hypothetical protein MAPG_06384 [Magnaporthiopsis poae ATCC 64411]|uniref:Uncharacterized protein n=1 Tax=Magnaporthiopsis poae (strain ATCC 64411 / 73-15) TaxID=644358 RepID=A0A0C4E1W2_MAGP6|nr:hypothetical protein MAPG_06384 [Magnaporthiopsis poae ATCC 64411]